MTRARTFSNRYITHFVLATVLFAIIHIAIGSSERQASANVAPATQQIGVYDVFEVSFTANGSYNNPYLNLSMTAAFNGPSNQTITVDGFWDGGDNWKVRMAPTEAGNWTYITSSSDSGLNGKSGSFSAVSSTNKGHVRISETNPYTFEYSDGTPFFWLADTNWDWDHRSTSWPTDFQNWVDTRANQKFTVLQGSLHPALFDSVCGANRFCGENEGGRLFDSISNETLNPTHFQFMDLRVQYIMSKGLTLATWFAWSDDWTTGGMNGNKYNRYVRYVIARYGAYNVIWGVLGEYEEIGNTGAVRNAGQFIKSVDSYDHPLTTHTLDTSADSFGNEDWIDFHGQQYWTQDIGFYNSVTIRDRAYGKPVVDLEIAYDAEFCCQVYRKGAWATLVGGGFATYGHAEVAWQKPAEWNSDLNTAGAKEMTHLANFWEKVQWWTMSPDNSLVNRGYALADVGREYVIYLPSGGSVTVDLSPASGSLPVEWYNPRNGIATSSANVNGGGNRSFTAPDSNDWALRIGGAPPDSTPPTIPQGLDISTISESEIRLNWQQSSDPESAVTRYNIYRGGNLVGQSTLNSFVDTGLSEASNYSYKVSATNGAGLESDRSSSVSATTLADVIRPIVVSVSASTDPTKINIEFSEPLNEASATDASNYTIDNGLSVSSATLGANLKTVTLTTTPHVEDVTYTVTIRNVMDRAQAPNIISVTNVGYIFVAILEITNVNAASGKQYELVDVIGNGSIVYIDRSYTFSSIPAQFVGEAKYIKTSNDDKALSGDPFLSFDVNMGVTIHVAYDDSLTPRPLWLQSYEDTGDDVAINGATHSILSKDFTSGTVSLGGNEGGSSSSMYSVVVMASESIEPSNLTPTANFAAAPITGTAPLLVNFDASSSSDPDGQIISYSWNFGDESDGQGESISHLYDLPGSYTVMMTVADNDGSSDAVAATILVTQSEPETINLFIANGEASSGQSMSIPIILESAPDGVAGFDISISLSNGNVVLTDVVLGPAFSTPDSEVSSDLTRVIGADFGSVVEVGASDVTLFIVTVTGVTEGITSLDVTLNILDDDAGEPINVSDITPGVMSVVNSTPEIASFDDITIDKGEALFLSGSFTDPGEVGAWSGTVDYGDSSGLKSLALSGTSFSLSHTYTAAGSYSVTVSITDDDGAVGIRVFQVTVNAIFPQLPGMNAPVQDLDGDGLAEDINANGRMDFADVVALFEYISDPIVTDNWMWFDFNNNGRSDFNDVKAMFDRLIMGVF